MKTQFKSIMFSTIIAAILAPVVFSSQARACPASIPVATITGTPQLAGVVHNKPVVFSNLQIAVGGANYEVISARVSKADDTINKLPLANQGDTLGFIMTHNGLQSVDLSQTKQYSCVYTRTNVYHINTKFEIEIELKQ